jgi:hypothetical protein
MSTSTPRSTLLLVVFCCLLQTTAAVTVDGSSAFDTQVNKILHWDGGDNLGLGPELIAALAIAVGAALTFFGYKLVRPCIFAAGFIVGSVVFFLLAERVFASASYVTTACWVAFVLGGLLVGSLLVWLYKVGIFVVGALAGVLLATQVHNSFGYKIAPAHPDTVLIVLMVVMGLAFGILAWKLERPFLVVASSIVGAIATVWGIGFFAGGYPNAANLQKTLSDGNWVYNVPTAWWGYLAATVALCGLGVYVQFRELGKDRKQADHAMFATPSQGDPIRHV